jgi:capsular exopolysaccharide synthesis family protein
MQRLSESSDGNALSAYAVMSEPMGQAEAPPPNLLAALWRYRWAVALPALLGAVIGFVIYLQMPDTYRSSARLMVESERSQSLDGSNNNMAGGVQAIEIVQSQLFSDEVIQAAFRDPRMIPFQDRFPGGYAEFYQVVVERGALELEPEFADTQSAQSVVMLLHFNSRDEELCEAAVKAFSDSLQAYYNRKHQSSRNKLLEYMVTATDQLHPEMKQLTLRYRNFRKDAPLQWDSDGDAINPFRQQQAFLVQRRAELQERLRSAQTELAAVEAVVGANEDPLVSLAVIGQLLERRFTLPDLNLKDAGFGADDATLEGLKVDRDLVPLLVSLAQMEAEYGQDHPKVRTLRSQVDGLRKELKELVEAQTARVSKLMAGDEKRLEEAQGALKSVADGLATQVQMYITQLKELDSQIAVAQAEAAKLAEYELQNAEMLEELEQHRALIAQVEEQMARIELTDEESGTRVLELSAPSVAYLISPILYKNIGIGTFLGLMLGSGLAFMLEKNSNTFRTPEEIAEAVGAPVLTHLPFFKGRVRKGRKEEINAYEALDSRLAVVHAPASVSAEAIRACRTSVFFETAGVPGGKVIQLTSPLPGDGKSTIAGNLACSIAQSGKKTIVLDCDLRRPQLTDNFATGEKLGLTDVLDGRCELSDAIHDTPIETLKIMPSGPIPANPAEALTLPDMSQLLDMLRQKFDYVILDSPPLLLVTDPSILASYVDGVLLAVKVRRKCKPNTKEAAKILKSVGANLLGVVVNNSDESGKSDGYQGHGYYRYGRQASRYRRSYGNSAYYSSKNNKNETPIAISGRLASREHANGSEAGVATTHSGVSAAPSSHDEG